MLAPPPPGKILDPPLPSIILSPSYLVPLSSHSDLSKKLLSYGLDKAYFENRYFSSLHMTVHLNNWREVPSLTDDGKSHRIEYPAGKNRSWDDGCELEMRYDNKKQKIPLLNSDWGKNRGISSTMRILARWEIARRVPLIHVHVFFLRTQQRTHGVSVVIR